ncbi:hypothetical protein KAR26_02030 [Candidatus Parcubacteria bacterium]|nr:hypothetical protein [Candidatus Parcubacteria bacterium]
MKKILLSLFLISLGILTAGNTLAAIETVVTNPADNFAIGSVQLNGNLELIWDEDSSEVWFEWGATTDYGNSTIHVAKPSVGVFSETIDGLSAANTYHFRAVAFYTLPHVGDVTVYGDDESFNVSVPVVATNIAEDITADSATLTGNLTGLGIYDADADVWFEWGTTDSYGNTTPVVGKSDVGTFSAEIPGLSEGENYYFRTVASNIYGTVYGDGLAFIALGADTWARTFTTGAMGSVEQTVDGEYIAVPGNLLKLDSVGNPIWAKDFTVAGCDDIVFNSIPELITGGEYIIAASCSTGAGDSPLIIRTDSAFVPLQAETFAITGYSDIEITSIEKTDGGYIILAIHDEPIDLYHSNDTFFIIKTNSNFNQLWINKYTETDFSGIVLRQTSDGEYIVTGEISVVDLNNQIFIAKFSADGTRLWANIYDGYDSTTNLTLVSVRETADGGCIVAAKYNTGDAGYNSLLLKVGSNGEKDWVKEYASPGAEYDNFSDVQQTVDGGYIIVGNYIEAFVYKGFIIKANSLGQKVWAKKYETAAAAYDNFYSVQQTVSGGYIIRGSTIDAEGEYRITLIKTDFTGQISSCSLLQDLDTLSVSSVGFTNIYPAGENQVSPASLFAISTTPSIVPDDVSLMPDNVCCNGGVCLIVPPTVLTTEEQSVTPTSAQLNGSLTDLGGDTSTNVWFQWKKTAVEPAVYSNFLSSPGSPKDTSDVFHANLFELDGAIEYYFRAVAQNTAGISYGGPESFTTPSAPNSVPDASGLSCTGDEKDMYCDYYMDDSGTTVGGRGGAVGFSWTYDHHVPMEEFYLRTSDDGFFSPPSTGKHVIQSAVDGEEVTSFVAVCKGTLCSDDELLYGKNYQWQVNVCDTDGYCSGWIQGSSETQIPSHRAPRPNFSWTVLEPAADRIAQFCAVKEGECSTMLDTHKSICYDDSNQLISCVDAHIEWVIPEGAEIVGGTAANPQIQFPETGEHSVTLEITGSGPCANCKSMEVTSYPTWGEVSPFEE